MSWCPGGDELDKELFEAMTEFISQLIQRGERLAESFNVPVSCMKAIHRLEGAVTMKDLGQRLHCDPSFVTMIADALEQRGLAKREPNPADRRIKNLVLTPHGLEVRATLEQELLGRMPWMRALSTEEREQLLRLVRKMNDAVATPATEAAEPVASSGEVSITTALPVSS